MLQVYTKDVARAIEALHNDVRLKTPKSELIHKVISALKKDWPEGKDPIDHIYISCVVSSPKNIDELRDSIAYDYRTARALIESNCDGKDEAYFDSILSYKMTPDRKIEPIQNFVFEKSDMSFSELLNDVGYVVGDSDYHVTVAFINDDYVFINITGDGEMERQLRDARSKEIQHNFFVGN